MHFPQVHHTTIRWYTWKLATQVRHLDIVAISEMVTIERGRGQHLANHFPTLALGADVVLHSAVLCGHGDALGGLVTL